MADETQIPKAAIRTVPLSGPSDQKAVIDLPEVVIGDGIMASTTGPIERASNTMFLFEQFMRPFADIPQDDPYLKKVNEMLDDVTGEERGKQFAPLATAEHGESLFHVAAMNGHAYAIEKLFNHIRSASDVEASKYLVLPHHAALAREHNDIVRAFFEQYNEFVYRESGLVREGETKPEAYNTYNLALLTHQFELADAIRNEALEAAQDPDAKYMAHEKAQNFNATEQTERLHLAIAFNNKQMFDHLLKRGASLDIHPQGGKTLLHALAGAKHVTIEMVDYVLGHEDLDVEGVIDNISGGRETSLSCAVDSVLEGASPYVLDRLLELGADPNVFYPKDMLNIPLYKALTSHRVRGQLPKEEREERRASVFKKLVENGANLNVLFGEDTMFGQGCFSHTCTMDAVLHPDEFTAMHFGELLNCGMRVLPCTIMGTDILSKHASDGAVQTFVEEGDIDPEDGYSTIDWLMEKAVEPHIQSVKADIAKLPKGAEPSLLVRAYAVGLEGEVIGKFSDAPEVSMALIEQTPKWLQETPQIKQQMTRLGAYAAHAHPGNAVTGWSVETFSEHAQGQGV